jgi:hypothetical protein
VSDLQHCSKCGEKCNPGAGMTDDVTGDRFHKAGCPVINHAARLATGKRLSAARQARSSGLNNSQTPNTAYLEQV